jgi:hypothetical protein
LKCTIEILSWYSTAVRAEFRGRRRRSAVLVGPVLQFVNRIRFRHEPVQNICYLLLRNTMTEPPTSDSAQSSSRMSAQIVRIPAASGIANGLHVVINAFGEMGDDSVDTER